MASIGLIFDALLAGIYADRKIVITEKIITDTIIHGCITAFISFAPLPIIEFIFPSISLNTMAVPAYQWEYL